MFAWFQSLADVMICVFVLLFVVNYLYVNIIMFAWFQSLADVMICVFVVTNCS